MDRRSPSNQDAAKGRGGKGSNRWRKPTKRTAAKRQRAKALDYVTKAREHLEGADYEDEQNPTFWAHDSAAGIMGPVQKMTVGALPRGIRQALEHVARNGVKEVATRPRNANRGDLVLDANAIDLPPRLFHLATILAQEKESTDEFNGFWKYKDVAEQLSEQLDESFSEQRVTNLVCRLKLELWRNHVNPYYIELGRRRVRLRWRRTWTKDAA